MTRGQVAPILFKSLLRYVHFCLSNVWRPLGWAHKVNLRNSGALPVAHCHAVKYPHISNHFFSLVLKRPARGSHFAKAWLLEWVMYLHSAQPWALATSKPLWCIYSNSWLQLAKGRCTKYRKSPHDDLGYHRHKIPIRAANFDFNLHLTLKTLDDNLTTLPKVELLFIIITWKIKSGVNLGTSTWRGPMDFFKWASLEPETVHHDLDFFLLSSLSTWSSLSTVEALALDVFKFHKILISEIFGALIGILCPS